MTRIHNYYHSPVGLLQLTTDAHSLTGLTLVSQAAPANPNNDILSTTMKQLDEYFAKKRQHFTIPLALKGTVFQEQLWQALQNIPYGQTTSYKNLANTIVRPRAFRAVGNACNRNPIPIFVPCHRVLSQDNKLTGFALGLDKKQLLLQLEEAI